MAITPKKLLIAAATATLLSSVMVPIDRRIEINQQFAPDLVDVVKESLASDLDGMRELITITSPGGRVDSQKQIFKLLEPYSFDTYVPEMAASAAADMTFMGKKIYVEPDAKMLFHGASAFGLTAPMIKRYLEGTETNPKLDLAIVIGKITKKDLKELYDQLMEINETMTVRISKRHNKDVKFVREKLFHNYEKDVFITGKELKDLGFDVILGAPDENEYKRTRLVTFLAALMMNYVNFNFMK